MKCSSELSVKFLLSETSAGADGDRPTEGVNPSSSGDASLGRSLSGGKNFSGELRACEIRKDIFSISQANICAGFSSSFLLFCLGTLAH